ncbi:hypothetical protein K491DRAFT_474656 [Lophiostoma macrostomum CBS 122681]|uniref:Uncharacterized protein n=1 Tax=Lophiostoma macrostomum CBS 122681 TaxID=1314788 RepID=A0A6A6T2T6_9PLEO|nr:hypothetical protein K491DRAFT_474656 [Lophiostoma macrostomum CBS 122681]
METKVIYAFWTDAKKPSLRVLRGQDTVMRSGYSTDPHSPTQARSMTLTVAFGLDSTLEKVIGFVTVRSWVGTLCVIRWCLLPGHAPNVSE